MILDQIKFKVFLVILSLTFLLWYFLRFNDVYHTDTTTTLQIINLPTDLNYVADLNENQVKMSIRGKGIYIHLFEIFNSSIQLDYHANLQRSDSTGLFKYKIDLSNISLPYGIQITNIDDLDLDLSPNIIIEKRIPIITDFKVLVPGNYIIKDSVGFVPETIIVSGPASSLNTLNGVSVKIDAYPIVQETNSKVFDASQMFNEDKVEFSPATFKYVIIAEELVDGKLWVPVAMSNLIPRPERSLDSILVSYVVERSLRDSITVSDFRATMDSSIENEESRIDVIALNQRIRNYTVKN
ncbi:MAG: hypothetical protein WBA16_12195 [Nonlabens sp.]